MAERRRQLWGRPHGPKLRPGQRRLLSESLPAMALRLPPPGGEVDALPFFGSAYGDLWLEIGFGGGEHLAALAQANSNVALIGVEPFLTGVARLLATIAARGLTNVRILVDDARLLLAALPAASLGRAFVLFPDPWPKLRHRKRRIVNAATVAELARTLRSGAELRLATDDPDYARAILEVVTRNGRFRWTARQSSDWLTRPPDWPPTRYEQKAVAAGRRPVFLSFQRLPSSLPACDRC